MNEKINKIINKGIKNIEKFKVLKKEDLKFINDVTNKYVKNKEIFYFNHYALNLLYPKNQINLNNFVERPNYLNNTNLIYIMTSEPLIDIYHLCNKLSERFKYVNGRKSIMPYQFIIEIMFQPTIIVYYTSKYIIKNIPSKNNIIENEYLMMDLLYKLITPLDNYYYMYFNYEQIELLIKNLKRKNKNIKFEKNNEIVKDIYNSFIINNDKIILVGDIAYKLINNIEIDNCNVIEFFSYCVLKDLQQLFKLLNKKYKIKIIKYNKFFIYFDYYYEIYINNKLCICIYNLNNSFNYLNINSCNVLNVHGQMLFLLNKIIENKSRKKHYELLLNNYLSCYKKDNIKLSTYQVLQTNIIGIIRYYFKEWFDNTTIYNKFRYYPNKKSSKLETKFKNVEYPDIDGKIIIEKEIKL